MSRPPGPAALKRRVETAIARATAGESRLDAQALSLEGLSSAAVRHLLNNLCAPADVRYLEVGTYKGSTLVAASCGNPGLFTAVDDFSEFGHMGPRETFEAVRAEFARRCRFTFHEADCWSTALRRRLPRAVNVYFYDGPHRYEDQYRAFTHFDPVFAETFIAVVDDWNTKTVRDATRQAFADLRYRTLHERELFTKRWLHDLWWNGLLVAVVRKQATAGTASRRPRPAGSAPGGRSRPGAAKPARGPRRRTAARGKRR